MRTLIVGVLACLVAGALLIPAAAPSRPNTSAREYVVLYESGASTEAAHAAIRRAGGTILRENRAVGLATVRSANADFLADATAEAALFGAAGNQAIGTTGQARSHRLDEERLQSERNSSRFRAAVTGETSNDDTPTPGGPFEPLAPLQWDMAMVHATKYESQNVQPGKKGVLVGIIDSGIDASHPDLAPNVDLALGRNFTTDIPLIDGPCEDEPDQSCSDAPNTDENGHGTHVAGTVAAAVNQLGISGVAPNVTLVSLRAGQESGYVFLQPVVDALTFAADHGIDVVNMSFYIDPWLFNCTDNPADSPAAQAEQRTIIEATNRALRYAHRHDVTLVGSAGNENTNLDHPFFDDTSPDFPPGAAYPRDVDNGCLSMPTEGFRVISVSALGPSTAKADYSNYGKEQIDVSAPGGYFRDFLGTAAYRTPGNLVLSTYAENVAREFGDVDDQGNPTNDFVLKSCNGPTCAYYTYLQGTSMAAPHAVGVAALIVSEYGRRDRRMGGLTLDPDRVQQILERSASDHACPTPRLFSYADVDRPPAYDAFCQGSPRFNGFYGEGIVNAYAAVLGSK